MIKLCSNRELSIGILNDIKWMEMVMWHQHSLVLPSRIVSGPCKPLVIIVVGTIGSSSRRLRSIRVAERKIYHNRQIWKFCFGWNSLVKGMTLSCVIIGTATGILVCIGPIRILGAVIPTFVGILGSLLARHGDEIVRSSENFRIWIK